MVHKCNTLWCCSSLPHYLKELSLYTLGLGCWFGVNFHSAISLLFFVWVELNGCCCSGNAGESHASINCLLLFLSLSHDSTHTHTPTHPHTLPRALTHPHTHTRSHVHSQLLRMLVTPSCHTTIMESLDWSTKDAGVAVPTQGGRVLAAPLRQWTEVTNYLTWSHKE